MSAIELISKQQLEQHLLRLDSDSRICRFGFPTTNDSIKYYVSNIPEDDIILGIRSNIITDVIVSALHLSFDKEKNSAELGISTLDEYKRRGYGERILRYGIDILRNRGVKQVYSVCAATNAPLMSLIRKLNITSITSSQGQKEAVINIPMAGIDSILHELSNDRMIIIDTAMRPWAELWERILVAKQ